MELVDTQVSEACGATHGSSSLPPSRSLDTGRTGTDRIKEVIGFTEFDVKYLNETVKQAVLETLQRKYPNSDAEKLYLQKEGGELQEHVCKPF